MTTDQDRGDRIDVRLQCSLNTTNLYPSLVLALRDLRTAGGRDPDTGSGSGNDSWIGLSLGMIVLDSLSGDGRTNVGERWIRLLTTHGVSDNDAGYIYALRNSLLHGYGLPRPDELDGRMMALTPDPSAYAVDTSQPDRILVSVPVFCGHLVERIALEAHDNWDTSLIDVAFRL